MPLPGFPAGWGLSVHLREVPFRTREDVLAPGIFPRWFRETDDPIRDVLADALLFAFARYASKLAARAAEANKAYATGSRLDLLGAQDGLPRAVGESDASYRARQLSSEDGASPRAILAAVDRITSKVTTKQAYYYERPDDEAFVFSKSHTSLETGFYVGAKQPVRRSRRAYDLRTRCRPRHLLFFSTKRTAAGPTPTVPLPVGSSPFVVSSYTSDDLTAGDNGHGHAILGLPAFLQPGKTKPSDCFVFPKASAASSASVFEVATTVARASASKPSGPAIYERSRAGEFVVAQISALLASRASFGSVTTLFFDPTL